VEEGELVGLWELVEEGSDHLQNLARELFRELPVME
jgi:hypothetical protein